MKKLCWSIIRGVVLVFIILSSGLAIYIHHKGEDFDPVKEIQKLRINNRRDDALDLTRFLRENQIGDVKRLEKLENDLEYGFWEKVKSVAFNGVIKGEVYDSYSGFGAIGADLCIVGDVRDLGIQSWKYLSKDPEYDNLLMILSAAGIGLSSTAFIDGADALAKNTVKYLECVPGLRSEGIIKQFLSEKISRETSEEMYDLLKKTTGLFPGQSVVYPILTA